MPINPIPPQPKASQALQAIERRVSGWHAAMLLLGIIIGFVVGYAV